MGADVRTEPHVLAAIRQFLLGIVALGVVGTGVELLLLGHFDGPAQLVPLILVALAVPVLLWHVIAPSGTTVRVVQLTMVALIAAGAVGVGLHYDGNVEFARELSPNIAGIEFLRKTLAGATPVFAPASLALVGLVGLAHAYRHPLLRGRDFNGEETLP